MRSLQFFLFFGAAFVVLFLVRLIFFVPALNVVFIASLGTALALVATCLLMLRTVSKS